MKILGIILAGGLSTRMEGQDKALLSLAGSPLIKHTIDRLENQVDGLVINVNQNHNQYEKFNFPVISDTIGGHLGPLAGILSGMNYASAHNYTHVITAASDTPFFPLNLRDKLFDETFDITVAKTISEVDKNNLHPTFGLWSVNLRSSLHKALSGDIRKVMAFVTLNKWKAVEWEKKDNDPFFNINTPSDMIDAEWIIKREIK
jgi:molybdopterin-guanine dinucleotide biosynthesis protein A